MKKWLWLGMVLAVAFAGGLLCGCTPDASMGSMPSSSTAVIGGSERPEQLYEEAKREKSLTILTSTTRVYDVQEWFSEKYPGITVDVQFSRATDLLALLEENMGSGEFLCDLVICSDAEALMSTRFLEAGVLEKYVPPGMERVIQPQYNGKLLDFMLEGGVLFYNSETYDTPPISNWWELTEPRFRGKFYMVDPRRSHTTNALLLTMIQHSDEMADAYEMLYGEPLDIPAGSNAGAEFWQRLLANDVQFTSSSDEALELVGTRGQADPPFAILVSSKDRKAELGYAIAPVYNMAPACGVLVPSSVMLSSAAEHPAAAKLFVHFLLGEEDGQGVGYTPFLCEGSWPVRTDVRSETTVQLEDTSFWLLDIEYMAQNQKETTALWEALREDAKKE